MKNIDLFYAVDGADDDMLMEAEDYFRVRSHRGLRRVALIAAVGRNMVGHRCAADHDGVRGL